MRLTTARPLREPALLAILAALAIVPARQAVADQPIPTIRTRPPARLSAELECVEGGGANVTLTVRNTGSERLYIKNDFHLTLDRVRGSTRKTAIIAFVFPARGFRAIPPGEERVFRGPLGTAEPGQDDGIDLRGKELILEAEFWFHGYGDRPLRRYLTFPRCKTF